MRTVKILILLLVLSLTGLSFPQESSPKLDAQTKKNLLTAVRGEAFAYAKYMAYAEHARKAGHNEIADIFEKAATQERYEHFRELADLAELVGSDADNLRDAIRGESTEAQTIYPRFADEAKAAGDVKVAERFREITQDELRHQKMFQDALDSLKTAPKTVGQRKPLKR